MNIKAQIEKIKANIAAAYEASAKKGARMPDEKSFSNLPETIASIPVNRGQYAPKAKYPTGTATDAYLAQGDHVGSENLENWVNAGPIQGPKSDTGLAGVAGPQGPKGDTGPAGPQGSMPPATGNTGLNPISTTQLTGDAE